MEPPNGTTPKVYTKAQVKEALKNKEHAGQFKAYIRGVIKDLSTFGSISGSTMTKYYNDWMAAMTLAKKGKSDSSKDDMNLSDGEPSDKAIDSIKRKFTHDHVLINFGRLNLPTGR